MVCKSSQVLGVSVPPSSGFCRNDLGKVQCEKMHKYLMIKKNQGPMHSSAWIYLQVVKKKKQSRMTSDERWGQGGCFVGATVDY